MRKKSFRLLSVLLSVFLIVTMVPTVVFAGDTDPITITSQPQDVSGQNGEEKVMSVVATNATSYQWQRGSDEAGWSPIGDSNANYKNAKTANLTIKVNKTTITHSYRCVVKNSKYTVQSEAANVTLVQPLAITTQPRNVSGQNGEEKVMSVVATGATSYQWQRGSDEAGWSPIGDSNVNYRNAKTANLTIIVNKNTASSSYRCVAKNSSGSVTSQSATVTLIQPLAITTQPQNVSGQNGEEKVMGVVVAGATSYQWQRGSDEAGWLPIGVSNANYKNAKTANLTIIVNKNTASFSYRCVAKNSSGSVTSQSATVTLMQPLAITSQPQNVSGENGEYVTMSIVATGAESYQWQRSEDAVEWNNIGASNFVNYTGSRTRTLCIRVSKTTAKYVYRCVVSNGNDSLASDTASVKMLQLVKITSQPQGETCYLGDETTLSVEATNATSYQWQRRLLLSSTWNTIGVTNSNYTGAKTNTLNIKVNKNTMLYYYRCVVSNSESSVESDTAFLNTVSVIYNGNGGLVVEPDKTTAETYTTAPARGEVICPDGFAPVYAERDGYSFDGWCFDQAGNSQVINYTPTESVIVYAKWTKIGKVTITFDATDGKFSNGQTTYTRTVDQNGYVDFWFVPSLTRSGYTFDGWFIDPYCTVRLNTSDVIAVSDMTFYAGWTPGSSDTVTVTWNANGGHDAYNVSSRSYTHTKYQNMYFYNRTGDFTRKGYLFDGWFYDAACTKRVNFATFVLTSDITFYAGWVPDNYVTITWDCNGGYFYDDPNYDMNTICEEHVAKNGAVTKNRPAQRTGYYFGGWYLDKACTTPKPNNMTATKNTTLYAKWTKAVTLTWDCNYGYLLDTYGNPQPVIAETVSRNAYIFLKYRIPEREGYDFTGWKYYKDGKAYTITSETSFTTDTNVYFTAQWKKTTKLTLTLNGNGGEVLVADETYRPTFAMQVDKNYIIEGYEKYAVRDGYFFAGWFLDPDGIVPADYHAVTENMTVYAKWIEGEHVNVIFVGQGGTVAMDDGAHETYGYLNGMYDPIQYIPNFERAGYSFGGWYIDADYTTPACFAYAQRVENRTTWYFAKWIQGDTVKITWDATDGHLYGMIGFKTYTQIVSKNSYVTEPPKASRLSIGSNKWVCDWYYDAEYTNPVDFDTFIARTDVTLYAKWRLVPKDS